VPVVISAKGVERVIELDLSANEKMEFTRSVEAVQNLIQNCIRIAPGLAHMG
jgi:malate dehydrogenase